MYKIDKDKLQLVFSNLQNIIGLDVKKHLEESEKTGIMHIYKYTKELLDIYKSLTEDKLEVALMQIQDVIQSLPNNISLSIDTLKEDIITLGLISDSNDIIVKEISYVDRWFKETYSKFWLFEKDNLSEVDYTFIPRIELALNKKLVRFYTFKEGNTVIPENVSIRYNKYIYIVDSINTFLRYVNSHETEELQISVIFKIEDIIDFSYFCIIYQYKNSAWIATDNMNFDNPRNKYSSRNAARRSEDRYDHIDFPYKIIDDINDIRMQSKVPVLLDSNLELHVIDHDKYGLYSKIYMYFLATRIIPMLNDINIDQITTYELHALALPEGNISDNASYFEYHDQEQKIYIENITKQIDAIEPTTALVKFGKQEIMQTEKYDPEWLCTVDKFSILDTWQRREEQRKRYQELLDKCQPSEQYNRKKPYDDFSKILTDKRDNAFKYLFMADKLSIQFINKPKGFGIMDEKEKSVFNTFASEGSSWTNIHVRNYDEIKRGHYNIRDEKCVCCKTHGETYQKNIYFHAAEQIRFLFDLKNEEMPLWFSLYRASWLIPYGGNSILDNVDPMSLLVNGFSKGSPNGYNITINICKICKNKLYKKYKIAYEIEFIFDCKVWDIIGYRIIKGENKEDHIWNPEYISLDKYKEIIPILGENYERTKILNESK